MVKVIGDAAFLPLLRRHQSAPRRYALIDIEDYERVTRSKWSINRSGKNQYVYATTAKFLAAHHRALHAYILRVSPGARVDHISGDTFDNRRQNLRPATASQNAMNMRRPTFPGKTSRFKGVCWSSSEERWQANIQADGVAHYVGLFDSEEDAAIAYDGAALRLHGEFARTNAVMKLFDMDDPFVPNCSLADVFDRHADLADLTPHQHRMYRGTYDQRLTDRLLAELGRQPRPSRHVKAKAA